MEKALGKVESIKDDKAVVLIRRGSMCGESCSNCGMCGSAKTKILAKNEIGAKVGECVVLAVETKKGIKAAMLVYGVPVLILFLSIIGLLKAGLSEEKAILTAFVIMAVWFLVIFILGKREKFKENIYARIVEKRD